MARPNRISPIFLATAGGGDAYAALRNYVAYWKFNEGLIDPSQQLLDASANALHVPVFNGPVTTTGKVNSAREFDMASLQYGLKADTALLKRNGKTWSLNLWFRLATLGIYQILCSKDDGGGGGGREFDLAVTDGNLLYANFNASFQVLLGSTVLTTGVYYNVQLDFTTGTKNANLYLNGVLEDNATAPAEIGASTAAWCFATYALGASNHLDGAIDNCYLYDKVVDPVVFYNGGAGIDLTVV